MPKKIINYFFVLILLTFVYLPVFAQTCSDADCAAYYDGPEPGDFGWYSCQAGTMCCIGDGCPSWVCGTEYECTEWRYQCQECCDWEWVPPVCGNWTWCGDDSGTYTCCDGYNRRVCWDCHCNSVCVAGEDVDVYCDGACAECPSAPAPTPENDAAWCEAIDCVTTLFQGQSTVCNIIARDDITENDTLSFNVSSDCGTFDILSGDVSTPNAEGRYIFTSTYTAPSANTTCTISASVQDTENAADNCTSVNILVTDSQPWYSVRGTDLYSGGSIVRDIPDSPLGGWSGHLMENISEPPVAHLYAFTNGTINVGSGKEAEKGGFVQNLLNDDYNIFSLSDFSFEPPDSAQDPPYDPPHLGKVDYVNYTNHEWLNGGEVYKISSSDLNNVFANAVLNEGTYAIDSSTRGGPYNQFLWLVVYVTDTGTVYVPKNVSRYGGHLLVIIPGDLVVTADNGINSTEEPIVTSTYGGDSDDINMGVIVGGDVIIEGENVAESVSIRTIATPNNITIYRGTGVGYVDYPALIATTVPRVYQLTKIARYHMDDPSFLGFTTFDVQFVPPDEIR